jgi:hypothetical protein
MPPTKAPTIVAASPETSSNLNPREASPEPKKQPPRYIPGRSALEQIRITELAAQDITKDLDPSLREAYNQIVQEMIRDVREGNEPSRHQNIRRMNQIPHRQCTGRVREIWATDKQLSAGLVPCSAWNLATEGP